MIGRLEDEKHSMVLKEVLSLTNRYPACLTINIITKLSALEDSSSSASMRAYMQELRNDFNHKISKERSTSTSGQTSGVTIVKVGGSYGSKGELSYKTGSRHEISTGSGSRPEISTGSRYELFAGSRHEISTGSGSRPEISAGSRYEISSGSRHEIFTGSGSRPEISTGSRPEISAGSRYEISSGSRHEISAVAAYRNASATTVINNNHQGHNNMNANNVPISVPNNVPGSVGNRKSESRSIGRLPTHRSMTRLNNFEGSRPPSSGGLHKSMTKLTSSQQNMARSNSQMVAAPTAR